VDTPRQPPLVIVDSRLETPPDAALFKPARPVWLYAAQAEPKRMAALQAAGAQVRVLPDAQGKVDLQALMRDLAAQGVNELHVEAGHKLNASLLRAGLVDELLVYLAPLLLGQGRGMTALAGFTALGEGLPMAFHEITPIGPDLRILARLRG